MLSIGGQNRRTDSLNPTDLMPLADDPVISVRTPKLKDLDLRHANQFLGSYENHYRTAGQEESAGCAFPVSHRALGGDLQGRQGGETDDD